MKARIPIVALAVSLTALGFVLVGVLGRHASDAQELDLSPPAARLVAEDLELEALKRRLKRIEAFIADTSRRELEETTPVAAGSVEFAELQQRIDDLSKAIESILASGHLPDSEEARKQREAAFARSRMSVDALARFEAAFLSRESSIQTAARALRILTMIPAESDPRNSRVVDRFIELIEPNDSGWDASVEELMEPMAGCEDRRLVEPILRILSSDTADAGIRIEAIPVLVPFRDDAEVLAVLRNLASDEADARVRLAAKKALGPDPASRP